MNRNPPWEYRELVAAKISKEKPMSSKMGNCWDSVRFSGGYNAIFGYLLYSVHEFVGSNWASITND
jgi:hypothetical protein